MSDKRAALYVKEAAGYPGEENLKDLQIHKCERDCCAHGLEITARYHEEVGRGHDFERMMDDAAKGASPSTT